MRHSRPVPIHFCPKAFRQIHIQGLNDGSGSVNAAVNFEVIDGNGRKL